MARMRFGQIGGGLILGSCVLLAAGLATGEMEPARAAGVDGSPPREFGGLLLNAALASLGLGAAVLGLTGPRPLGGRPVRVGLVVLAVGLVSLLACILTMRFVNAEAPSSFAVMLWVCVGVIGLLAIAIGTLVIAVSLVRSPGVPRFVGALFLVGLLSVFVFRLLANGSITLGDPLDTLGGGAMLVAVAGLGILAIRGARAVPEASA